MKIEVEGDKLRVSGVKELGASNASSFRHDVREAMRDGQKNVDVDLSDTTYVDSCGLGALISLYKAASGLQGTVRLLHPQPSVQQILELTRMHRIFEIVEN
jgi:anti-sigma B factor antagonist